MIEPSTILMRDLHAYIDRELDADSMEAVAAHLADSPADAARVAEWQLHAAEIRAAFDATRQAPLAPELAAEITGRERSGGPLPMRMVATLTTFLLGLAAGFVLGFSL
jgi:anti-sigma factor RsiW